MTEYKGGVFSEMKIKELLKRRQAEKEELKEVKQKIAKDASRSVKPISSKFSTTTHEAERQLKQNTVGLVSLQEFKKKKEELALLQDVESKPKPPPRKKRKRPVTSTLSFALSEEEDEDDSDGGPSIGFKKQVTTAESERAEAEHSKVKKKKSRFGMDPTVQTDFLPDKDKEKELSVLKEQLKREWELEQIQLKARVIDVTYSYWDGSGHRREAKVEAGTSINDFFSIVREQFAELNSTSSDNLMFIKEDLIIPSTYTFHDLIDSKARGKSGALFHFDVHDDIRVLSDARKEKDESHAAKVVTRSWYNRNKHLFPASRWEVFDPKKDYGTYTTHGREVQPPRKNPRSL